MCAESGRKFSPALRAEIIAFAVLLLLSHIGVLLFLQHSQSVSHWSDVFELAAALFTTVICLTTSRRSSGIARPFWYLAAIAFGLWSLGKCLVIYDYYYLGLNGIPIIPIVLFFLAAAPLFVAVFLSDENFGSTINWEWILDAAQIFCLILVTYLFLIYIPLLYKGEEAVTSLEDRLLLWRNILLTAGLLIRALVSRSRNVRRLYLPVAITMGIFAVATWFGNRAQSTSDSPSAWYDLAWSVPFCLMSVTAASWIDLPELVPAAQQIPQISRVMFAHLPSLMLPVVLMLEYHNMVPEQMFLGLFGLVVSIILFNARLVLTQRRQRLTAVALQAKESQYRSLFEQNMAGVFRCTLEGKILDCNPAFANMFGYSREELLGIPLHQLYFDGADEGRQSLARIARDLPLQADEFCLRRKDGSQVWILLNANLEKEVSGSALLEGTVIDITEKRRLELQLRQAQKMEAIGRLAGGIAHDFNNLLTIISGYSSIQLERTAPSDALHHEAEQIKGAADRAAALTRQLLAFSRQQVLQPRNVNLNDLVRSLDKMLRRLIGEDIEMLSSLAPDLGTVRVDPGQIDQVLMNLIVNARDAMPDGGKLTIQTENFQFDDDYARKHDYTKPGRYVLLSVSDSGIGIPPETRARIFEPFFTTKEPGKGTGLGLPMVYGIVKQSGGSIEVYSEVNHGTTMKIYLPRVDEPVDVSPGVVTPSAFIAGSERILVVEDDPTVRDMVVDILKSRNYTVHAVEKIDDLESVFQSTAKCDLLLTDVIMPKIKGPEIAARAAQRWPGIKILYMSGYTTNAVVHQGVLDAGVFFLQKPFESAVLAAKVREVLNAPSSARR